MIEAPAIAERPAGEARKTPADLAIVARAIGDACLIEANYNRGTVTLAPYVLYEKDEAMFVDAVTIERDGRPPREVKLGAFRVSGLSDLAKTSVRFRPYPEITLAPGRYRGQVLARLKRA